MFKKFLAIVSTLLVLCLTLVGCGGANNASTSSESQTAQVSQASQGTETTQASGKKLKLGSNNFLKGIYSVDILENGFAKTCEALGVDTMIVNDEGKVEKTAQNIDNMISAGVDGIVFFGISETLFPVVSQKCQDAKIPFVCFDHMPSDANLQILQANPYFKGVVATKDIGTGANIGEQAAKSGLKKAVIITGKKADPTHSARTKGFTDAFTAGGGTVEAVAWDASNLADATTKANDLFTAHPDIDCVYASNGDYGSGTFQALQKHKEIKAQLFVTDLDPDVLKGLENGTISAANGAHWINVDFATTLLVNALNGKELKGDDGKAPILIAPVMTLPSKLVNLYNKFWIESQPFSAKELQQFVVTNNKDITLKDYQDVLANYTVESRLLQKEKDGLITAEELAKVGIK